MKGTKYTRNMIMLTEQIKVIVENLSVNVDLWKGGTNVREQEQALKIARGNAKVLASLADSLRETIDMFN